MSAFDVAGDRSLQARERKIVLVALLVLTRGKPSWETDRINIAELREPIDVRAPRVGQLEKATDLIESLTCGIVEGPAQFFHIGGDVLDEEDI